MSDNSLVSFATLDGGDDGEGVRTCGAGAYTGADDDAHRLAKYWNASNGYVFDSFGLEKYAVGLSYYGVVNLQDYLFTIMDNLGVGMYEAQWRRDRVERAKTIIATVRSYEANDMPYSAESEVKKLIPE